MSNYIKPDRSNRPESSHEPMIGRTVEVARDREKGGELCDGRPYVVEAYGVDGYTMVEYWFDSKDLEAASVEDLLTLLRGSGIEVPAQSEDSGIDHFAKVLEDARGRPVWKFCITWSSDF